MNLKAVAGAIKSPKTPQRLKEGLIRKYGKQLGIKHVDRHMLKDIFPKKNHPDDMLEEDICKTCEKPQTECSCGDEERRCLKCRSILIGLERKGTVCNKCLSRKKYDRYTKRPNTSSAKIKVFSKSKKNPMKMTSKHIEIFSAEKYKKVLPYMERAIGMQLSGSKCDYHPVGVKKLLMDVLLVNANLRLSRAEAGIYADTWIAENLYKSLKNPSSKWHKIQESSIRKKTIMSDYQRGQADAHHLSAGIAKREEGRKHNPGSNCKNYLSSTHRCQTGCKTEQVIRMQLCPFYVESDKGKYPGDFQSSCACYNKSALGKRKKNPRSLYDIVDRIDYLLDEAEKYAASKRTHQTAHACLSQVRGLEQSLTNDEAIYNLKGREDRYCSIKDMMRGTSNKFNPGAKIDNGFDAQRKLSQIKGHGEFYVEKEGDVYGIFHSDIDYYMFDFYNTKDLAQKVANKMTSLEQSKYKKHKKNPGAKWHEKELAKSLKNEEKEYDTSSRFEKGQYMGEQIAHRKSIMVSKTLGINPQKNPGAKWHEEEAEYYKKAVDRNKVLRKLHPGHKLYKELEDEYGIKRTQHLISAKKSRELGMNPPKGAVKIYDKIEAIEAQKGKGSLWPDEYFRHDFKKDKTQASVYGMPDGSLMIKGKKPLWKNFNYPEKGKK